MRYKVGMSDKRTRSKSTKARMSARDSFNLSSRNINGTRRPTSKRTPVKKTGAKSRVNTSSRSGIRKFSKLGVVGKGINTTTKRVNSVLKGNGPNKTSKISHFLKRSFAYLLSFGIVCAVIGSIVVGLYLKSLERSLPSPDKLVARSSDQSTILFDRNGNELFKIYGDENRQFVKIDEIPQHTRWALLAAEDIEFYQHKGMDYKSIARCGLITLRGYLRGGGISDGCGASTITQQLVRNTLMYDVFGDEAFERGSVFKAGRRKLREILLSMQVEQNFTKDEILQLYMNEVALGGVNYGFEAAAQSYFGKGVKELDLAESALLAGLIQSPSYYSPLFGVYPELAKDRQEYVFRNMERHQNIVGIPVEEIEAAREQELVYRSGGIDIEAYHFVFYVKRVLEEKYGAEVVERGGLRVTTTLDLSTQRIAQEEITRGVEQYGHRWGAYNGAMVVIDPNTGQILAMVGSVDHKNTEDPRIDGNVNVATSLRQMGSSFKPYVYLTAFEKYGPWIETPDIPMNFGNYKPINWDDRYFGLMTAREALIKSRNIPANYTMQLVGIDEVIKTAEKAGITTLTDRGSYGLSLALGSAEQRLLEHTHAFSIFATGGINNPSTAIMKVVDSKGEVLEEFESGKGERVFDEKDVYMLNWVLCDLGGFGDQPMSYHYVVGGKRVACGKTGTTNGPKDLVSMYYNKNLAIGIWVGNNNGVEVPGGWSTTVPLPMAHSFMERVIGKYPSEMPTRPSGILAATVCNDTGLLAGKHNDCNKVSTIYVEGRAPAEDKRQKVYICKENGLIATNAVQAMQFTDAEGNYQLLDVKMYLDYEMLNPAQTPSYQNFIGSNTSLLIKKPEEGFCPMPLGPGGEPVVSFEKPTPAAQFNVGDTIDISATAWAGGSVKSVEFYFNGSMIGSQITKAPFTASYPIPISLASGNYTILAKVLDDSGKMGTASVSVNIVNPKPISIGFNNPSEGSTFSSNINMNISASITNLPDGGSVKVNISGPEGYSWNDDMKRTGPNWTAQWSANGLKVGTYRITINAAGVTSGVNIRVE